METSVGLNPLTKPFVSIHHLVETRWKLSVSEVGSLSLACFNPPPSRNQVETHRRQAADADSKRFNPPPSRNQVETRMQLTPEQDCRVSIHHLVETRWKRRALGSYRSNRCFNPPPSRNQVETPSAWELQVK